jgi:hypothetical protein
MDTYSEQAALTADEMQLEIERAFRRGVIEALSLLNQYVQLTDELTVEDLQRMMNEQMRWQRKIGSSTLSEIERVATLDFSPLHQEVIQLSRQRKRRQVATRSQ